MRGWGKPLRMESKVLELDTSRRQIVDLTSELDAFVRDKGDGLVNVFVPHATAGLAIIELGAGSDDDLLSALSSVLPKDDRWRHRHGHQGHGADHVMPAFISPAISLPVIGGQVQFGTWQSLALVDTNVDNPHRYVRLSFLAG
jgi:secondary thiamine-phosphate synthase enzyme